MKYAIYLREPTGFLGIFFDRWRVNSGPVLWCETREQAEKEAAWYRGQGDYPVIYTVRETVYLNLLKQKYPRDEVSN